MPIRVVHVVAKSHLDLGFTALAAEVEHRYLAELFPRAIATASALADGDRGDGPRLVWTTGSWILHRALHDPDGGRADAVRRAVEAGHLTWHALPLTFHTELMDAPLVHAALAISAELDGRFGRTTVAAKMTDVPGHTRGLVPLLARAGVRFLHLGVNPAWPVPEVPPAFRWRAPDGSEVVVAYQAGGYGGEVVVDGCDHALAFLHAGDNLGPPGVDELLAAHRALRERHPGAEVRGSTLDAFARALDASGAVAALPVVTSEIGDPWLFGAGSDPQKVAAYRALLAHRNDDHLAIAPAARRAADRTLLLVAEHTWGLDQKEALPDTEAWTIDELAALRATPAARRFEASWVEQRAYVDEAAAALVATDRRTGAPVAGPPSLRARDEAVRTELARLEASGSAGREVLAGEPVQLQGWTLALDATGAVVDLRSPGGRRWADPDHPLGRLAHHAHSSADYERFYADLVPGPGDAWWARWDNTKPGIERFGDRSARRPSALRRAWIDEASSALVLVLELPDGAVAAGAPPTALVRWALRPGPLPGGVVLGARLGWFDKPASRLPESSWFTLSPLVAEPRRWMIDKLGHDVSPLDVVRRGGRSLHAVGERGIRYAGSDGHVAIRSPDAPLVAPGAPTLLDADPPLPDLDGGFHVLLHDNCWGTNFPMWNEGPASFRFDLDLS